MTYDPVFEERASSPHDLLGIAPGAPSTEVHRAAAAKIGTYRQQLAAGRLDPAAGEAAYASVYTAVAGLLGLRMALAGSFGDPGAHSVTVGGAGHTSFVLSESSVPAGGPSFGPGSHRMPYECEICGCFPAVPVTAVRVLSVLLAAKVRRETRALCRECGVNVTRRAQAYTRAWGHFGLGVIAAWISLWRNRRMLRALKRLPAPYARRPGVLTPETRPRTTGWFLRLCTFGAGLGWPVLLVLSAVAALQTVVKGG
jgi:hypothetical protein